MRTLSILLASLILAGCNNTSLNPILESSYIGDPSAEFFLEFGPPDSVIPVEPTVIESTPGRTLTKDKKELYYYWSSINKKTAAADSAAKGRECQLAIRTSAVGTIKWIEVLAEQDQRESAVTYCSSIVR